jgi:prepilin-type N-terminal cleavage/methylation domain-containing protein
MYYPQHFTMTRPHNKNSGFTLIEMLTVVIITGILAAIALPSFFKSRTFANTVPQIESSLKLISLKARANSGNPYRLTLMTQSGQQLFRVDSINNNNCSPTNTAAAILAWESDSNWKQDPSQTFYLPTTVVISGFPAKGFCFNSKGEAVLSAGSAAGTSRSFNVLNADPNNSIKASKATVSISVIGDISYKVYDQNNQEILNKKFN